MEWLILYIVGVIISNVLFLKLESEKNDIMVFDLVLILLFSMFSWLSVFGLTLEYLNRKKFWDKVVIHKRK